MKTIKNFLLTGILLIGVIPVWAQSDIPPLHFANNENAALSIIMFNTINKR